MFCDLINEFMTRYNIKLFIIIIALHANKTELAKNILPPD